MKENDTICLLKECDAGTKMAVASIEEVIEDIQDSSMKEHLKKSREHHTKLGNEIHNLLLEHHSEEKEPDPFAKGMSWLKTNVKMGMDSSDATAAELITDGCHMGVKSLHKYLNQYEGADHTSKEICKRLIQIEEDLCNSLSEYL